MILADQFECTIPSANAVKQGVLYCTTNPPVAAADSQTWATWATAFFTLLLAGFALAAWLTARSSLHAMKEGERTAFKGIREQIAATDRAARQRQSEQERSRQISSLATYLQTLYDLLAGISDQSADLRQLSRQVVRSGLVWRMHFIESRVSTGAILDFEGAILHILNRDHRNLPANQTLPNLLQQYMETIDYFISVLQKFQTEPRKRQGISVELRISAEMAKADQYEFLPRRTEPEGPGDTR